jgi:outer membrane receptor protein involved in Fe transport
MKAISTCNLVYVASFLLFIGFSQKMQAGQIFGTVLDEYRDPLVGATIEVKGFPKAAIAGLDGSFQIQQIPSGSYEIEVRYIGYVAQKQTVSLGETAVELHFVLEQDFNQLNEVVVIGESTRGSESQARFLERNALNTLNVVSARSMELSPDVTVAQVIQRVSGLSVERNSSGDAQHAIIRGMNKRYNYTLVNGVKIPSPDDRNRYVPLDIFPAQMLERLEVSKSLTAAMEGDAIGGAMNMVMRRAPDKFEVNADLQLGYSQINLERGFWEYDRSAVNRQSPEQRFGADYEAGIGDFSTANLVTKNVTPLPDFLSSVTIGNRYLGGKLGVMLGGSVQNTYRGVNSDWYDVSLGRTGSQRVALDDFQEREASTFQNRMAAHARLDYRFNARHNIGLYAGRYHLNNFLTREITETTVDGRNFDPESGNVLFKNQVRTRSTYQVISTASLQGEHELGGRLSADWSAVLSLAENERPDNASFTIIRELRAFEDIPGLVDRRNSRRWEAHSDLDFSLYLNFNYQPRIINDKTEIRFGGMFRDRDRGSSFNRYTFDPIPLTQQMGIDWNRLDEVSFRVNNPRGNTSDPLNFDSYEQIGAAYLMALAQLSKLEISLGARGEQTVQGYFSRVPLEGFLSRSEQLYFDLLPSMGLKYNLSERSAMRGSYFRAINRPGFFEIVDYVLLEDEDFNQAGNPELRRAIADNFDLRFELFPRANEQLLIGAFYKNIADPIEIVFGRTQSLTLGTRVLRPENLGNAQNFGFEFDYTKYFNRFGIRANYTYTNSRITTDKASIVREDPEDDSSELITINAQQTRPLQGQADHIANLSLLYKDLKRGTDAQLSAVYVGERLEFVSPFLNNDHWSRPITILDLSVEQRVGKYLVLFVKINNLLDTPYELFIKNGRNRPDETFQYQTRDDETFIRRDRYFQTYRLGARFKL